MRGKNDLSSWAVTSTFNESASDKWSRKNIQRYQIKTNGGDIKSFYIRSELMVLYEYQRKKDHQ